MPHIFIVLSDEQDIIKSYCLDNEIFKTGPECAFTVLFLPFLNILKIYTEFFQIFIYLSSPHDITFVESALNNTSLTAPL